MPDRTTIVNNASLMVGGPVLSSWDDTSRQAALFKSTYESTKNARLAGYPWRFALKTASLASRPSSIHAPESGYTHVFMLPEFQENTQVKCLRPVGLLDPYKAKFGIFGDELHTNSINTTTNTVQLLYIGDVTPAYFSDNFVHSLELELAAKFAISIKEDRNLAADLRAEARLERRLARNLDAKSTHLESMNSNILGLLVREPSTRA